MESIARFSLVVSTVGRPLELDRLFRSLVQQTYANFEIVLVDQSGDNQLNSLVTKFSPELTIRHLRSGRGLSLGRNIGLVASAGEIVAFPDDDCWYAPDTLERVASAFAASPSLALLSGTSQDDDGVPVGRWDADAGPITRRNVWRRGISIGIFLRRHAIDAAGEFDERLGVGSGTPFGSGEETDLLIRVIDRGFETFYDPTLIVGHPNKKFMKSGIARSFDYGAGMGFVLSKQRYGLGTLGTVLIRPLGGAALNVAAGKTDKARYHLLTAWGRLWGYRQGLDRRAVSQGIRMLRRAGQ